jgi:hypothetical protein
MLYENAESLANLIAGWNNQKPKRGELMTRTNEPVCVARLKKGPRYDQLVSIGREAVKRYAGSDDEYSNRYNEGRIDAYTIVALRLFGTHPTEYQREIGYAEAEEKNRARRAERSRT